MTLDAVNKWLSAGASLVIIAGAIVAIGGVVVAIRTLKETHGAASATLVLKLRDTLDGPRYTRITAEIQDNNSAHPLIRKRGGKFHEIDVEGYIMNFEDISYLVREKIIIPQMAYDHFSYDVEKAWCNADVELLIGYNYPL
jgi:hypothetical protein